MSPRAPKQCGRPDCETRVVGVIYCDEHTTKAWATSRRVVPKDWKQRIALVLARDGRICYVCGKPGADEVDHVINVAAGGTHELGNLKAIHGQPCHREKTKREAAAGRRAQAATARHPVERHPGLLP